MQIDWNSPWVAECLGQFNHELKTTSVKFYAVNIESGATRALREWELGVMLRLLRANPKERLDKLLELTIDPALEYVKNDFPRLGTVYLRDDARFKALEKHRKRMIAKRLEKMGYNNKK